MKLEQQDVGYKNYFRLRMPTLGLSKGVLIICLADLCACTPSFYLSRRYGREVVQTTAARAGLLGTFGFAVVTGFVQRQQRRSFQRRLIAEIPARCAKKIKSFRY
jgi:hypothetical protein